MKTLKIMFAMLVLILVSNQIFSQSQLDTLYKKSGKIMVVKVTEVLPDVVKYIYPNGKDSIIMGVDREELKKICFANGAVQLFMAEMVNPENYALQHKSDIKVDFLAPTLYKTTVVYERSVKPGMSWETGVTIVGMGSKPSGGNTDKGAIFGGGVKFTHTPDYYARGQHYSHILKGGYIRLQGFLGYYTESYTGYNYNNNYPYTYSATTYNAKDNYTIGGLHIQVGKQYVFDDIFCLDIFGGIGYALVNVTSNNPNNYRYGDYGSTNNFVFVRFGDSSPLSISGGLRIGILF